MQFIGGRTKCTRTQASYYYNVFFCARRYVHRSSKIKIINFFIQVIKIL